MVPDPEEVCHHEVTHYPKSKKSRDYFLFKQKNEGKGLGVFDELALHPAAVPAANPTAPRVSGLKIRQSFINKKLKTPSKYESICSVNTVPNGGVTS